MAGARRYRRASLGELRRARAVARERAWLARADRPAGAAAGTRRRAGPGLRGAGPRRHPDRGALREGAASAHFKSGFGYHPLLCFLDNTNEALAGILRTGRAGSNTAADHITVLDQALAQLPEAARAGAILVRTDGAGFSTPFLEHLPRLGLEYSVGYAVTEDVRPRSP